jgi:hypothetical protein
MHCKTRAHAPIAALTLLLSCSVALGAVAAPIDDLANAVARGGAPSISEASPRQFLRAYMSILVRAKPKEVIWYVNAAVKSRPDLAPKIVVATLNVRRPNAKVEDKRNACQKIGDIIQAAVMANPDGAAAIVKAAVEAEPLARDCIIAAASAAAPDQRIAFLQAAGEAQTTAVGSNANYSYAFIPAIGTINPADYTPPASVNSPEQPPPAP